jgi:hypothetical protein
MKKELYIPLILIGLSVAFVVVSFLVWITRGNDSLLKKKLRIGGFILLLSGAAVGCKCDSSCYIVARENQFIVEDQYIGGRLALDMSETNKLTGLVSNYTSKNLWYLIEDHNDNEIQRGAVEPLDGAFDEHSEDFEILVRIDIPTGEYKLEFYMIEDDYPLAAYDLHVTND